MRKRNGKGWLRFHADRPEKKGRPRWDLLALTEAAAKKRGTAGQRTGLAGPERSVSEKPSASSGHFVHATLKPRDISILKSLFLSDFEKMREDMNWVMHDLSVATRNFDEKMKRENEQRQAP